MTVPEFEDPRAVLRRHNLAPKRSFSQNFLTSHDVVEKIAEAATRDPETVVIELGPGCGTLTTAILRRGSRVVAVERDRDMIGLLRKELASVETLEVVEGDAASVDLGAIRERLGAPITVAGNLPYSITGEILRHLVDSADEYDAAVVMVQREVRDRLLAEPASAEYGALTVFVQARMRVESVALVPAGAFHPPPKVGSAVVRLIPLHPPRAQETDAFRKVVRAAFQQRRKMLRNALRSVADDAIVVAAADDAGIDLKARGETLSVEQFDSLARAIESWLVRGGPGGTTQQ
jgi:16S rRNA (adenine1518-N6/adenine1519-N6)-dimethyltransferase